MKYLGIHKLLWFFLVVSYTLLEGILFAVFWICYVTWNLKFPSNLWTELHTADDIHDTFLGEGYSDRNILETVTRRYKMLF